MQSLAFRISTRPATRRHHAQTSKRCLSGSAASPNPFSLNALRASARQIRDSEQEEAGGGKVLRMLMFGKPGAGKGTLSARLVKKYDIVSLSTGDLLRQHIQERTEVGRQAEEIVAQGALMPDDVMLKVVSSKLDELRGRHWILDGFPRTLGQGELLDAHLKKQGTPLSLVVNLDVPDEVILSRISDRWVHLPSGRVYNLSYNRPKVDGLDDETGEPLTKRPDDNPETFARRLEKYYSTTSPLLDFYSTLASAPSPSIPHRNPHQHPHQLSFHDQPPHRLTLESASGATSDEIWPKLAAVIRRSFPSIREKAESVQERRRHSLSDAVVSDGSRADVGQN